MPFITHLLRPDNSITRIAQRGLEFLFVKSGAAEYRWIIFIIIKNEIQYFGNG